MEAYTQRALNEYNTISVHPGGVNGNPFWNMNSTQFTFVPSFYFPSLPNEAATEFLYTATDKNDKVYTFKAEKATAPLTPIWGQLPTGVVTLKVEALDKEGKPTYLLGARTFFKCSPFPGRENLPERARSYKEAAYLAFKYVFEQPMVQHWLKYGIPDPEFPHNVYPAKTISSIIRAMIAYSEMSSENGKQAIQIARSAADYMLSITYGEDSPLCGLPPTYSFKGLNAEKVNKIAPAAEGYKDTIMMIYPASAGVAYLTLFGVTGDKKYFDAALKIANYYKENVLPNGNWYLQVSTKSGLPVKNNYCTSFEILTFFEEIKKATGSGEWDKLSENYFGYLKKFCLDGYNWEGQFEDSPVTANYYNLTHLNADKTIEHIINNKSDDSTMFEAALELMRFVEDQFVVWGEYAPWIKAMNPEVRSPAGLEQYFCYWPIDGSTSAIMRTFLQVYLATKDPLYFEKGAALGDMMTRMQNPKTGVIPTFWTSKKNIEDLENFWINCHIGSAFSLFMLAKVAGEI